MEWNSRQILTFDLGVAESSNPHRGDGQFKYQLQITSHGGSGLSSLLTTPLSLSAPYLPIHPDPSRHYILGPV